MSVEQEVVENKNYAEIKEYVERNDLMSLAAMLNSLDYTDILDILDRCSDEEKVLIFENVNVYVGIKCFKVLSESTRKTLVHHMNHEKLAKLLNNLPDDDLVSFVEDLPSRVVNELLKGISEENRRMVLSMLGYPENSVGRLMTPHYIAVKEDWTTAEVFEYIRHHGENSETLDVIYVVDNNGVMTDDIRLREFLLVDPTMQVRDIMDHRYLNLLVTDDNTTATDVFRKNNRFALPVVDEAGILIGIVTIDDVLRLSEAENTEDIQKIGGSEALDEPYNKISFANLIKKRAGWLVILFLGEMLTATAMGYFEGEISKAVVLALFIPLIISSGGNSGSQASSIIIRAMALGEVKFRDWWRVMSKELLAGFTLGSILGAVGFLRIVIWQKVHLYNYGVHWLRVATTVSFALVGVVMWGTLAGSMLPIVLKRLGADPAASSAPFVATLVDVTGLIIYFSVAYVILNGTIL